MRAAFAFVPVVVLLAGCGGVQNGSVTPVTMAQSQMHRASGSSGDLLYVLTNYGITLVSYPNLQVIGNITDVTGIGGICSDPYNGNVFLPYGTTVLEYAHGGTTPIATLTVPSGYTDLQGCSVDPTTGNLAVTSYFGPQGRSGLFVFPGGQGTPTLYNPEPPHLFLWTTYDNLGNLYVPQFRGSKGKFYITELPAGQSKLVPFRFKADFVAGDLQWDGTHLVTDSLTPPQGSMIYQLQLANGKAKVTGIVKLQESGESAFSLSNNTVFQAYWHVKHNKDAAIAVWSYPQGGKPTALLYGVAKGKKAEIEDVTLSVAPTASHTRK